MNLNKTIQLLQQDLDDPGSVDILDLNQAQHIGIEALQQLLWSREHDSPIFHPSLPSETKE